MVNGKSEVKFLKHILKVNNLYEKNNPKVY